MEKKSQEPLLSENQAWDLLEFAQALTLGASNVSSYLGYYTPDLLNQNLVELNNNARVPTFNTLLKALNDAVNEAENLQAFTEWGEWVDMLFKRTMAYYENMLSFDLMYVGAKTKRGKKVTDADMSNPKYNADRDIVDQFLIDFDYKAEFRKMVKLMLRNETAFTWLRNNEDPVNTRYTLQLMPQQYCKLTEYWERGMLYDFDMNYFLRAGVDVEEYDPIFKRKLEEYFRIAKIQNYNPTNSFDNRNGSFAYWVQTSPIYDRGNGLPHGAWVFKFDTSNFSGVPFLSALLKDTILNIPIQKLQYDKDAASAHAILAGEIKMLDSNEPNATAFSPKNLGTLMNIVKKALGKYVGVGAVPAQNIKWYQYKDQNTDMYNQQIKSSAAQGASASRILYADDKMSQEEVRNAITTDYNVMYNLYAQFNNFLEFYVNQLTKWYNFAFMFNGSSYEFERKEFSDKLMNWANVGMVLNDTVYASAMGIPPQHFRSMLMESHADNSWLNNLSMLMSIHTQPGGGTNVTGRPTSDDVSTDSRDYDTSDN